MLASHACVAQLPGPPLACPHLACSLVPPSPALLPDAIYRDDLVFKDPQLSFRGLRNYKLIFWSLRFHGRLFLQAAHVQVRARGGVWHDTCACVQPRGSNQQWRMCCRQWLAR